MEKILNGCWNCMFEDGRDLNQCAKCDIEIFEIPTEKNSGWKSNGFDEKAQKRG